MPMTDPLLKVHGYGPDIQCFVMQYPMYFPKNAGKAYRALHSRLQTLEQFYEEQEKQLLPSLASISLKDHHPYDEILQKIAVPKLFTHQNSDGVSNMPKEFKVPPVSNQISPQSGGLRGRTSQLLQGLDSRAVKRRKKLNQSNILDETGRVTAPVGVGGADELTRESNLLARRALYYSLPCLSYPHEGVKVLAHNELSSEEVDLVRSKGLLRRFHVDSGLELAHAGSVNDVCFSTSERRVASAGGDGAIKLWDPRDGALIKSLTSHEKEAMSVLFSKDELFLVSGGLDGLILVWNMIEFNVLRTLRGHSDCIYSLAALEDISILYSASHDKTIKTWHLNPQRPSAPSAPRAVGMTDTSILISWKAPPAFNEDITAFHLQYRVGLRNPWMPGMLLPYAYQA